MGLCFIQWAVLFLAISAHSAEFVDEFEKDFPLKSVGALKVTNGVGSTTLQGWSMDKIRVKVTRKVEAATLEESQQILKAYDVDFSEREGNLELSVLTGKDQDLGVRLKERKAARVKVDLLIKAPAHLNLDYWGVNGNFSVQNWNSSVSSRLFSGEMKFEDISTFGKGVAAVCPECKFEFKSIKANLRCLGGKKEVLLHQVAGREIYVETSSGNQLFRNVSGQQMSVSADGKITGESQVGSVDFGTRSGDIALSGLRGRVSGRTGSGAISVSATHWDLRERSFLESDSGSVHLELPEDFSGTADLWSVEGKVEMDFPFKAFESHSKIAEPVFKGKRLRGVLGTGMRAKHLSVDLQSERDLRVNTLKGSIRVSVSPIEPRQ